MRCKGRVYPAITKRGEEPYRCTRLVHDGEWCWQHPEPKPEEDKGRDVYVDAFMGKGPAHSDGEG